MSSFTPANPITVDTAVSGPVRTITINGETYTIEPNPKPTDLAESVYWDAWRYVLPNGQTYTHVNQFGCLLMILKAAGGDKWQS